MVPFCSLRFSVDCSAEFRRIGTHVEPTGDKAMPTENLTDRKIASLKPAKVNKKAWQEDERLINRLLRPEFGSLNVKEITRSHVRSLLREIAAGGPVQANRAHACLRKIFNWAIKEEIVDLESNPASGISSPGGREHPRERSLSDAEIREVWKELESNTTLPKRALQLVLLTGQRPGEVAG